MAKGKIQRGAWVEINRENFGSIRKSMPAYDLCAENKSQEADPLLADNGQFDVRRGGCFVRINDKPKGSPVVLFDYPDGIAAMIADGNVTWSYCEGRHGVDWKFELKDGGFLDENGNKLP